MDTRYLFLICILTRLALSRWLFVSKGKALRTTGYILLLPAFGFLWLYMTKKSNTGMAFQGTPIWWHELRLVHAALYFMAGIYAIQEKPHAWIPIFIDTLVGLGGFVRYRT